MTHELRQILPESMVRQHEGTTKERSVQMQNADGQATTVSQTVDAKIPPDGRFENQTYRDDQRNIAVVPACCTVVENFTIHVRTSFPDLTDGKEEPVAKLLQRTHKYLPLLLCVHAHI